MIAMTTMPALEIGVMLLDASTRPKPKGRIVVAVSAVSRLVSPENALLSMVSTVMIVIPVPKIGAMLLRVVNMIM
jgi:hypothetical protein